MVKLAYYFDRRIKIIIEALGSYNLIYKQANINKDETRSSFLNCINYIEKKKKKTSDNTSTNH